LFSYERCSVLAGDVLEIRRPDVGGQWRSRPWGIPQGQVLEDGPHNARLLDERDDPHRVAAVRADDDQPRLGGRLPEEDVEALGNDAGGHPAQIPEQSPVVAEIDARHFGIERTIWRCGTGNKTVVCSHSAKAAARLV